MYCLHNFSTPSVVCRTKYHPCLCCVVPPAPVIPCWCPRTLTTPHQPPPGEAAGCMASRHRTISVISVFKSANYPIKRGQCPVQRRGAHATLASVASTADSETRQQVLGPGTRHKYTSIQLSAAASGHAGEGSLYQAITIIVNISAKKLF